MNHDCTTADTLEALAEPFEDREDETPIVNALCALFGADTEE